MSNGAIYNVDNHVGNKRSRTFEDEANDSWMSQKTCNRGCESSCVFSNMSESEGGLQLSKKSFTFVDKEDDSQ